MNLNELKRLFSEARDYVINKPRTPIQIEAKISNSYGTIIHKVSIDMSNAADISYKNIAYDLKFKSKLPKITKDKIIKEKVKGKNWIDRIKDNGKKLIKDIKKIGVEKKIFIAKKFKSSYNKVVRIIRTDSHRIIQKVKNICMNLAEKANINFKRKWVATLVRTRDQHRHLHLTYADKNGYFHSEGAKTQYPGGFGIAHLDINCKCKVVAERIS